MGEAARGGGPSAATTAVAVLRVERIVALRSAGVDPVVVALDGRSGAGKSSVATVVSGTLECVVIDGDDFYRGGSDAFWDAMSAEEKTDQVIEWRRQRRTLETLRQRRAVSWCPYDWAADDGRLGPPMSAGPAGVVLLEGAYSARPELRDLLDLRALLDVPTEVRRDRLLAREGEAYRAAWEDRWCAAEDYYFSVVMPPTAFDVVLRER